MNRILLIALSWLVSIGFAHAATIDVRANKKNQLQFVYQFTGMNCNHGPKILHKIVKQPKNGTLSLPG